MKLVDKLKQLGFEPSQISLISSVCIKSSTNSLKEELQGNFYRNKEDLQSDVKDHGFDLDEFTNEYAVISNDKGSQFELRFSDHGDGHDFTVDNISLLYRDEDDDEDYEGVNDEGF